MSIMERMRELESYDDNSLIEMITNGNPRYPQYAVLGEIQRREDLRRITKNQIARQNQPNMTVADRKVMEFSQGAMPMNPVNTVYNQAEPSATPAGLGSVAPIPMSSGKKTTVMTAEEMFYNLPESLRKGYKIENVDGRKYVIPEFKDADDIKNLSTDLITPESFINNVRNYMGKLKARVDRVDSLPYKASTGLAGAISSIGGIFAPNTYERYLESTQPNRIYSQVPSTDRELLKEYYGEKQKQKGGDTEVQKMNPGGLLVLRELAKRGLPYVQRGLGRVRDLIQKSYTKRNPAATDPARFQGSSTMNIPLQGGAGVMQQTGQSLVPYVAPRVFSPLRTTLTGLTAGSIAAPFFIPEATGDGGTGDGGGTQQYTFDETGGLSTTQGMSNEQQQGFDLARTGFAILASKNMAEFGANMLGVLNSIEARGGTGTERAQADYYKAQTAKIGKELENYDLNQLQGELSAVNKSIEALEEAGQDGTAAYLGATAYLEQLIRTLAEKRGFNLEQSFAGGARVE